MSTLAVLAAAVASYVFGAIWYMVLAKPWMSVSGVPLDDSGHPVNRSNPVPYLVSIVGTVLVAGMMRHAFVLGNVDTVVKGFVSGAGIGLFFVAPWIATNYGFANRPLLLVLIDAGYAIIGCTIIGTVLTLF